MLRRRRPIAKEDSMDELTNLKELLDSGVC
jgi:hypothetical protein